VRNTYTQVQFNHAPQLSRSAGPTLTDVRYFSYSFTYLVAGDTLMPSTAMSMTWAPAQLLLQEAHQWWATHFTATYSNLYYLNSLYLHKVLYPYSLDLTYLILEFIQSLCTKEYTAHAQSCVFLRSSSHWPSPL